MTTIEALNILNDKLGDGIKPDAISQAHIIEVCESDASEKMPAGSYLVAEARFVVPISGQ